MKLDIAQLARLAQRPPLYAPGQPLWDDLYIATQMLKAHLDPRTDAASRKPETIDRHVSWILSRLKLPLMAEVVDLGCGPGLYAERLCRKGIHVTGIDLSANSLDYARRKAKDEGLDIAYRRQNYLEMQDKTCFDAAIMIYYDMGVLSNTDRDTLLAKIWLALKPGGRFVIDLATAHNHPVKEATGEWSIHPNGGFWRPGPYMVLEQCFDFPDAQAMVDQYLILEDGGQVSVYRNWEHYYAPETIRPVLERAGFVVEDIYADLTGAPYGPDLPSLAVVARKA